MTERPPRSPQRAPAEPTGRYKLGEVIASGGMGTVYRAFDRLGQRSVAYKRLRVPCESMRSQRAALFRREYDTLAHLSHPNIVAAHEYGFDALGPYYTMELLTGADLRQLAPLCVLDACRILRDVASALALLHARKVLHRDVSPGNVRLTDDGTAKLIDFGALTPFGIPREVVGTPALIAPECLRDVPLDARTDLYALGALAYWCLTGRSCVRARSVDALERAWREPIVPPSVYEPDLPPALEELVLSLLRQDANARPSSAAYVIERLTAIAGLPPEHDEQRVAYSYLQHPPLLGREGATHHLLSALAQAVSGQGQVVFLGAEQGFGRSALLAHLAVSAQLSGATVLRAQGGLHTQPFSAARTLVHAGMGTFPHVAARVREHNSLFRLLVESSDADAPSQRSSVDVAERKAFISMHLHDVLVELSAENPLLILVDDAHAVDAESLALFASMLETVRGRPMLLVLSARAGAVSQHAEALAKLEAHASLCRLGPLSEAQLCELTCTIFGGVPNCSHLARWLYEQTGGNPGQCMGHVRLLLASGAIRYTVGTFTLPHDFVRGPPGELRVSAGLLANLSGLSPEARRVAHLLGVHTGPVPAAQLASASGLSERAVLLALEELAQRSVAVSSRETHSCASEALREALRSSIAPNQRRAAHLALAKAFGQRDQSVLEHRLATAHHLLSAGGPQALQGAHLLAETPDEHKFAMASSRPTLMLLERGLRELEQSGVGDAESLGVLVPLSLAGFYGDLDKQGRYLERTLRALKKICGLGFAERLRGFLGPRLSLLVGILTALCVFPLRRHRINRRTFAQHFETFGGLPGAASAAAACVWDVPESARLTEWLEPFAHASRRSALYLMREFCVANAELVSVKLAAATERYSRVFSRLEQKVFGIDELHAEQFRCGCLHGKAQALVTNTAHEALEVADELARRSRFFAPHAEGVRMTYHAFRGEARQAAVHRARAEALAFRGGTTWSATSVLTIRSVQACVMSHDIVGLMHAVADLSQLAPLCDSMAAIYDLARAHLEQLRGRPERALPIYEEVFAREITLRLPSYPVERSLHARALSSLGRFDEAHDLCLRLIDEVKESGRDSDHIYLLTRQQLARAQAGLGDVERAARLLEDCLKRAREHDNPLSLGSLHQSLAQVALRADHVAAFARHFAAMTRYFKSTQNVRLLQQCDALHAEARRLGMQVELSEVIPCARPRHDTTALTPAPSGLVSTAVERAGGRPPAEPERAASGSSGPAGGLS